MTNGDKLRTMTDEELSERFGFEECEDSRYGYRCPHLDNSRGSHCDCACKQNFLMWLKMEAQDE